MNTVVVNGKNVVHTTFRQMKPGEIGTIVKYGSEHHGVIVMRISGALVRLYDGDTWIDESYDAFVHQIYIQLLGPGQSVTLQPM